MTITKYRPRTSFVTPFSDLMNDLFHHDIGHFIGHDDVKRGVNAVNITESPEAFDLRLLAPGFSKQDLKLRVENNLLTVSAEKKQDELKENERWTRREFSHTTFSRSFRLPETVNAEAITAAFTDGVLHLSIPKMENAKPRTREISIG
jgi:HSP20 family protein